jgi:hypothetical protein
MKIKDAIENARKLLEKTNDYSLVVYILRDFPEIEAIGLDDLAWAYSKNYCTKSEAESFINTLEKRLENK